MHKLLISLFIGISLLLPHSVTFAQEASTTASEEEVFDFEKAYKDYVYMTDLYKKAHSDYVLARAQFMQAETLASQTKAKEATAAMLQARDDVIMTYLTALRLRLMESQGVSDTDRNGLYTRIDNEVAWYGNHKAQIPSAGTLNDLVADSEEAKEHFVFTEPLAYEILAIIPIGKTEILRTEASTILSLLKIKTDQIRANGDLDTTLMERWTIETEFKLTRSLDKELAAQQALASVQSTDPRTKRSNKATVYETVITNLQESNQLLKEAVSFMKEIVKEMKVQK